MRRGICCILLVCGACGGDSSEPTTPDAPAAVVSVAEVERGPAAAPDEEEERPPCTLACAREGLCARQDGACMATEDAHCSQSKACRVEGRCVAHEGGCIDLKAPHRRGCKGAIVMFERCLDRMDPQTRPSFEQMVAALRQAIDNAQGDPNMTESLEKSCQSMLQIFSSPAMCPGAPPPSP